MASVQYRALTLSIFSALAKEEADSMVEKRCGFGIVVVILIEFFKCV
jgi:hypothetical protein